MGIVTYLLPKLIHRLCSSARACCCRFSSPGSVFPIGAFADIDFFVVYNAFLLNTSLPQEFFDHPGYLSILPLSYWLRLLHGVGLVHVQPFSAVPPLSDARLCRRVDAGDAGKARAVAHLRHGFRCGVFLFVAGARSRLTCRGAWRLPAGFLRRHGHADAHAADRSFYPPDCS